MLQHHAAVLTPDTGRQDPDGGPLLIVDRRWKESVVLVENEAQRDV